MITTILSTPLNAIAGLAIAAMLCGCGTAKAPTPLEQQYQLFQGFGSSTLVACSIHDQPMVCTIEVEEYPL